MKIRLRKIYPLLIKFLLLEFLVSSSSFAQSWVEVGKSDKATYFIDTTSIRNPNRHLKNTFRFDVLINLSTLTEKNIHSIVLLQELDCLTEGSFNIYAKVFRDPMGKNLIESSTSGGLTFALNQKAKDLICKK